MVHVFIFLFEDIRFTDVCFPSFISHSSEDLSKSRPLFARDKYSARLLVREGNNTQYPDHYWRHKYFWVKYNLFLEVVVILVNMKTTAACYVSAVSYVYFYMSEGVVGKFYLKFISPEIFPWWKFIQTIHTSLESIPQWEFPPQENSSRKVLPVRYLFLEISKRKISSNKNYVVI